MTRRKYSHVPCYFLRNQFGEIIGAHFRRLALLEHALQEAWGPHEILMVLPTDKTLGMSEGRKCIKLEQRIRAIGWRTEEGIARVSYDHTR